jgi:hypothetical protein
MANKQLFQTLAGKRVPAANAVNEAGGLAYALAPMAALAQYAATGCLNVHSAVRAARDRQQRPRQGRLSMVVATAHGRPPVPHRAEYPHWGRHPAARTLSHQIRHKPLAHPGPG